MKLSSRVVGPIVVIIAMAGFAFWLFYPTLVAIFASDPPFGSITIKDVSQAETLRLGGNIGPQNTHRMTIRVTGQLDGTAGLSNPTTDNSLTEIGGTIDLEWSGDYYSSSTEIRYVPRDVRNGKLKIEYSFHGVPTLSPRN